MPTELKRTLSQLKIPSQATWVGLRAVKETTTYWSVRDGKPDMNLSDETRGLMVEVLVDGQLGYAATPRPDTASVQAALERALDQARQGAKHKIHSFTETQRPKAAGKYLSPRLKAKAPSSAEINTLLIKMSEKLKVSPKVIRTNAMVRAVDATFEFASTNGSEWEQDFLLLTTAWSATAAEGNVVQRRSDGDDLQTGYELLDNPTLWDRVIKVGEQAVELVGSPECPTTTTDLVLMPDQMVLQVHESIGHPLELDRILGDERNYAGWSFVRKEDFGKLQYGSKLMNVTFDPTVKGEFASYSFDDSGFPAGREHLIKDGVLLRGLGGLESQERLGVPGVANFRASSWNRAPIDRMANLNLEPGDSSFDEIIGSVEKGVLMETNRSWSIDDYRNKFQFGCEYAKLIENGKLTKTVRNPNYRGITNPFWRGLKKVGDRSTWVVAGTPNCGKGEPNQVIRVGHATPVCLFENVEVFGGAG